jgi:hypothetical protein
MSCFVLYHGIADFLEEPESPADRTVKAPGRREIPTEFFLKNQLSNADQPSEAPARSFSAMS